MIKYKYGKDKNHAIFQLVILWIFGISVHWYVAKGDHTELSLSLGPFDFRLGTSVWWHKIRV